MEPLNLNVHIHGLVLDGVFEREPAGTVRFHPARRLTTLDVAEVLATVEPRIRRLLDGGESPEGWSREAAPSYRNPLADVVYMELAVMSGR